MRLRITILSLMLLISGYAVGRAEDNDSLSQRVTEIESEIEGINEPLQALITDVTGLKKLKVSGYMQTRFDYSDSSKSAHGGESKNTAISSFGNNFYIRRGRVKFSYEPTPKTSKYVLYLNFSRSGYPTILEAYSELYKNLKPDGSIAAAFTIGQFNIPFGYEIEFSSSKRDFGERSLAENALFPGERDRGINLNLKVGNEMIWQFNVAALQGRGINGTGSTDWQDFTKPKDVIGRIRANWKNYYIGASYYSGETYIEPVAFSSTWTDANKDSVVDPGEVKYVDAKDSRIFEKVRRGVDAQAYFDLLRCGGTAVKAELFQGFGVGSNDFRFFGYYIWLSQQLGTKFGFAYRFDSWDPNTYDYSKGDRVNQHDMVLHYYWDSNVRLSVEYIMPKDQLDPTNANDKDRNDNTIRFQSLFVF